MNKVYKVDWTELKTSVKGAQYMRATLTDETGQEYPEVTIFSSFPNFANIRPGEKISGIITAKDYKGKQSYSLDIERTQGWGGQYKGNAGAKTAQIATAQEVKKENINQVLDRKDEAIRKASIIRDSSLITAAQIHGKNMQSAEIELYWKHWESFLQAQWDKPF